MQQRPNRRMAAATPNDLSPATSIHSVAEMPLEDLKLNKDLKLWTMSYFCCEILALQHAVLILAANRNLNQSVCMAVVTQHQQLRVFPTQGLRCLPGSSFFSHQHCEETLFIVLTFGCLTVSQWSHSGHWLTPALVPCIRYSVEQICWINDKCDELSLGEILQSFRTRK